MHRPVLRAPLNRGAARFAMMLALTTAAGCSTPLPAELTVGDLSLRPRPDGSFDLSVGGRVLLQGRPGPLRMLKRPNLYASLSFGQFEFSSDQTTEVRPAEHVEAAVEGDSLRLSLSGSGGSASLRFHRTADEVTIVADGAADGASDGTTGRDGLGLAFACQPESRFLGFGEQYGRLDHRGEAFPLWVSEQGVGRDPARPCSFCGNPWTTYFPVPFFLDPRGFGLAVDTSARVQVDLCKSDPAEYSLVADERGPVTLHLYAGPTPAAVLRAFTARTGRARSAPRWSVEGAWLGVQGGPAAVRSVVQTARRANAPVGAVWAQDWIGRLKIGAGLWDIPYHWTADTTLYPDLPGLIKELRSQNVRFLGYFNPFILSKYDQWAEAVQKGYAVTDDSGIPYEVLISVQKGGMLDVTNPAAVTWFQGFAKRALDMGMSGWMGDFGEWLPYDGQIKSGQAALEHNLYPTRWHRTWQGLMGPDDVVFTRSGWLGEGDAAQVVWVGDQQADWEPWDGLPTVTPAMISLGLAGVAWVTHDIAGYTGGPSTKELYLRWLELGAFSPIFRTHEGLASDDNWRFDSDAETLAAFSRWARVHQKLADTFVALGQEHQKTGMPIVRALALTFPGDAQAVGLNDEFTIGDDLLVAPVTTQGAVTRALYLPAGQWTDVWDPTKVYTGPLQVTVAAPIGRPPVFSRSGRTDLAGIR